MSTAPIEILEGAWWSNHEVPLILPYFQALACSHRQIDLSHRTIRNAADIAYYVSRIKKGSGALLYFASHGKNLSLTPTDGRSPISTDEIVSTLGTAKSGAVAFVHFGCCEMVAPDSRRESHQAILDASGARWASGYTKEVDWLQSTFLDLALVSEVFVPQHAVKDGRKANRKRNTLAFFDSYEQLARSLGFSALSKFTGGHELFPERLRH